MLSKVFRALAAGALAGFVALVLDGVLAYASLGYAVPVSARVALFYVATGVVIGLLVLALKRDWGAARISSCALAALYALPVFERFYKALENRVPPAVVLGLASVAVLGYAGWTALLCRLASPQARPLAFALAALTAAAGLALNRNVIARPFTGKALGADLAVLLAVLGLGLLARLTGPRRASAAIAALFVAALAAGRFSSGPPVPDEAPRRPPRERPNVVMVIIDTLRQDVFEAVVEEAPEGRAFRESLGGAAWFSRAVAAAPWTIPSMGSVMTGLYPPEHGFGAAPARNPRRPIRRLADSLPTLAQSLRRQGYQTGAIGANPLLQPFSGIARGFESYEVLTGSTTKLPLATVLVQAGVLSADYYQRADVVRHRLARRLGAMAADERPLFLWLHLMDPHYPLQPPTDLAPDPAAEALSEEWRLYRDETRFALRELTAMFDLLRSAGFWDDTVLLILSDHGEMFPSDGHAAQVSRNVEGRDLRHGHALYGELVRIPLVIRPPGGLAESRRIDALASHVDLFDTVADLVGLELARAGAERRSLAGWLAPELTKPPPGREEALISGIQHGPPQRALRTLTHKLIDYQGESRRELFHLPSDPGELRDLSDAATELEELDRRLTALWSNLLPPPAAEAPDLDAATRRRLKALGYL